MVEQIGDRVGGLRHGQRGVELPQALLGDLGDEPAHPAEMGVHRHRRGPRGPGDLAGLQRVGTVLVEQADRGAQHLVADAALLDRLGSHLGSHHCHFPIYGVRCL